MWYRVHGYGTYGIWYMGYSIWYMVDIRILHTMLSGIPLILGLGTRMSDPYVYVVFWPPRFVAVLMRESKGGKGAEERMSRSVGVLGVYMHTYMCLYIYIYMHIYIYISVCVCVWLGSCLQATAFAGVSELEGLCGVWKVLLDGFRQV